MPPIASGIGCFQIGAATVAGRGSIGSTRTCETTACAFFFGFGATSTASETAALPFAGWATGALGFSIGRSIAGTEAPEAIIVAEADGIACNSDGAEGTPCIIVAD